MTDYNKRYRGFPTLASIWAEAERRGWHLGTTDSPSETARWLSADPTYADLSKRALQLAKDEERRAKAIDIDWSKMSAAVQAHGLCRYCEQRATKMRKVGRNTWVPLCGKHV